MDSPNRVYQHTERVEHKHEFLPTTLLLVIFVLTLTLLNPSSYAQTTLHTTSHIGINDHSRDRQQGDQHHMHKQMLDDNAFSDLSRNTTSSGSKTGDNTSSTR